MSKGLALYFAVAGTILLAAFAASLSFRNAWISLALIILTVLHIGCGFIVRARQRKKRLN